MTTILRLPAVIGRTGLSRSTIYQQMSIKQFPRSIKLGPRAVGWVEKEIDDWLERKVNLSRKPKHTLKLSELLDRVNG